MKQKQPCSVSGGITVQIFLLDVAQEGECPRPQRWAGRVSGLKQCHLLIHKKEKEKKKPEVKLLTRYLSSHISKTVATSCITVFSSGGSLVKTDSSACFPRAVLCVCMCVLWVGTEVRPAVISGRDLKPNISKDFCYKNPFYGLF